MGEYADRMIDGEDCQQCGMYIGPGVGYPRNCEECGVTDYGVRPLSDLRVNAPPKKKVPCPICQKPVKEIGMRQHMEAVHPTKEGEPK